MGEEDVEWRCWLLLAAVVGCWWWCLKGKPWPLGGVKGLGAGLGKAAAVSQDSQVSDLRPEERPRLGLSLLCCPVTS